MRNIFSSTVNWLRCGFVLGMSNIFQASMNTIDKMIKINCFRRWVGCKEIPYTQLDCRDKTDIYIAWQAYQVAIPKALYALKLICTGYQYNKNDTRHGQAQISCTVDRCRWAVAAATATATEAEAEAKTLRDIHTFSHWIIVVFGKLVSWRAMQTAMYVRQLFMPV